MHKVKGLTLTELLIVLAILGVLLLLAFPVITPIFAKTHAMEAKTNLKHLSELQKVYYLEHMTYSDEFIQLGFEQPRLVTEEDGTAHFQIEVLQVSRENYMARATAITDFDGDGVFNVWEVSKNGIPKEVVPD
ncbi:MAG: type IV pilin protein [Bacteroidota bacterium]